MARIIPWPKRDALALFRAALGAADPERAVLHTRLGTSARLLLGPVKVVAVGKAAPAMVRGLRLRLSRAGGTIERAWIVGPEEGGHPLPDRASVRSAQKLEQALRAARPGERWIFLLSGGASALVGAPRPGLTLSELMRATKALLESGASIDQMNAVRKHLSRLGGGAALTLLAEAGRPGSPIEVLTLALSDVPSDRIDTIGSGPSVPDPTTYRDCIRLVRKHKLERKLPRRALLYLRAGATGQHSETLKRTPRGVRSHAVVIASASASLNTAASFARSRGGYITHNLGVLAGENGAVVRKQAALTRKLARGSRSKHCLVSGGELSIKVTGPGRGGRNQEFVLAMLCELARKRVKGFFIFAAGTDGKDGNTPVAGAFADESTLKRARSLGLDPERFLRRNDSYSFFKKVDGLVRTGPTGTNVMDFRAILLAQR